ncbi:MAG: hypothetical protein AAF517_24825 [Planctomycetota bacterium]
MRRRDFLRRGTTTGAAFFSLPGLASLPLVGAEDADVSKGFVQFRPEIEPLVRTIEETSRDKLLEVMASKIRAGLSYREVVAALFLAGIRNVEPRPHVGFQFHTVLVVNSAHVASMSSPAGERWLPIFWALDHFKGAQARDQKERGWTMPKVKEFLVPSSHEAAKKFAESMDAWDEYGADASAAALARSSGANAIFEQLWRYGMRDFRSIGHKAIYVANAWRTLQLIGWRHLEPVARSLAYALLNHEGEDNPAKSDHAADRPWRRNLKLAETLRADWASGEPDDGATRELLVVLREGSDDDASKKVVEILGKGVSPQSIWDALFAAAGEQVLRQPGIVPLHSSTTMNALHFAYSTTSNDNTRRMVLLQAAAFLTLFRGAATRRGKVSEAKVDQFEAAALASKEAGERVGEVFVERSKNRNLAIAKALTVLESGESPKALIDEARRLVFLKGRDAHDYKFSSAVLEDYFHVSPAWRNRYLAASVSLLRGAGERDNGVVARTRAALES